MCRVEGLGVFGSVWGLGFGACALLLKQRRRGEHGFGKLLAATEFQVHTQSTSVGTLRNPKPSLCHLCILRASTGYKDKKAFHGYRFHLGFPHLA